MHKYTLRSSITKRSSKLKQNETNPMTDDDKHSAEDNNNNDSDYAPSQSNAASDSKSNSKTNSNTNTNTDGDSASSSTKTPRGDWNTTTLGAKRYKRKRKFTCPKCKQVENSVANMNDHYRTTHGKLSCQTCHKLFSTPSALRKHSYLYKNNLHKCNKCPKSYAFASKLASHKISHRSVGMYSHWPHRETDFDFLQS